MALSQKTKGILIVILFIAILIAPVCYAFIRDRFFSHTEVKVDAPPATPPVSK